MPAAFRKGMVWQRCSWGVELEPECGNAVSTPGRGQTARLLRAMGASHRQQASKQAGRQAGRQVRDDQTISKTPSWGTPGKRSDRLAC